MITHDRPEYTKKSLEALLQNSVCSRVWVWHNGDDPVTLSVVKSYDSHPRFYRFFHSHDNVGLTAPTNWLWQESEGSLLGKVDDDCIVPNAWDMALGRAHADASVFGVISCWHFRPEDFLPALAKRKIRLFPGGHKLLVNPFVGGSGYLMKRSCFRLAGSLRDDESFTTYCLRVRIAGWVNGWYYPFIFQEHMDDPRSPYTRLRTDEDVRSRPSLTAQNRGVTTLSGWLDEVKGDARRVQSNRSELWRLRLAAQETKRWFRQLTSRGH